MFPKIEAVYEGSGTNGRLEHFSVRIPEVETIIAGAVRKGQSTLQAYAEDLEPIFDFLDPATDQCNLCPVNRQVCKAVRNNRMKLLAIPHSYRAQIWVTAYNSENTRNATEQLEGSLCGLTAQALNTIHKIKV